VGPLIGLNDSFVGRPGLALLRLSVVSYSLPLGRQVASLGPQATSLYRQAA